MKLSQWHDGSVKPVHEGVYERLYNESYPSEVIVYCLWDGWEWKNSRTNIKAAANATHSSCIFRRWRGIAK